jgi:hypothetical protein
MAAAEGMLVFRCWIPDHLHQWHYRPAQRGTPHPWVGAWEQWRYGVATRPVVSAWLVRTAFVLLVLCQANSRCS